MLTGGIAASWLDAKMWMIDTLSLSRDALHVHLALVILFASALALRCRPDRLAPWLIVMALEFFNEAADMALGGDPDRARALAASWHDIANTMAWPTIILIAGRWLWPMPAAPSATSDGSASADGGGQQPLE